MAKRKGSGDEAEGAEGNAIAKLLAGDVTGFDEEFQKMMRGSAGADVRRAHVREYVAERLFDGNYDKAHRFIGLPNAALEGLSICEAAETHDGMLQAKALIVTLEAAEFSEVSLAFAEGAHRTRLQELDLLLDLLPAAWGMDDDEFEQILDVSPGWLRARRNHEVGLDREVRQRLARLEKLHNTFRLVVKPQGYAEAWRSTWASDSPIGRRSPWQAYQEDGDAILDTIEAYFLAQR